MYLLRDFIFFAFGLSLLINSILFVPQIIKILREKTTIGFSKITFVGFCITQVIAVIYGCLRHDWILAGGYLLAFITCGTVTILIFVYGNSKVDEEQAWILEDIIGKIPGHVWWKDKNLRFLGCNDQQARIAGLQSRYEIKGKRAYDAITHEQSEEDRIKQAQEIDRIDRKVIETGQPHLVEEPLILPDGTQAIYLSQKEPLRDRAGNIIGLIGTAFDITARKESEQLRHEIDKQLLQDQEKFRKVVDQVVHDIRSPLASLGMFVKSCGDLPEENRIMLREIVTRISDIANNLLSQYAPKTNNDLLGGVQVPLLVSTCLSELLADKKYEYQNLNVKLEINFTPDSKFAFIKIDTSAFKRMISNIINNSVDALDNNKGEVSLQIEVVDKSLKIHIKDNGKGMTPQVVNAILSNISITEGKSDGHGIGLTQVRETLEQNNGNLSINSEIGKGTTITLAFPLIEPPQWIAEKIELNRGDIVVILDDDPSIHRAWNNRFILDTSDVVLNHFEQGTDAINFISQLSAAEKHKVFLLSDFELLKQNLNGLDIISQTSIDRAVLVTSHYSNKDVVHRAINAGVKILPKVLAPEITIQMSTNSNKANGLINDVDIIFVEDDHYLAECMKGFVPKNKVAEIFNVPEDLLANISTYDKQVRIIFDNSFADSQITGLQLAGQLHNLGFSDLCLCSGSNFSANEIPCYLKVIPKLDTDILIEFIKSV